MKPGEVFDWAELTHRQAIEADEELSWRLAKWAEYAVRRGGLIFRTEVIDPKDPLPRKWRWEARFYPPRTRDEARRRMARARMWVREALSYGRPTGQVLAQ